jgi:hypothetical protein
MERWSLIGGLLLALASTAVAADGGQPSCADLDREYLEIMHTRSGLSPAHAHALDDKMLAKGDEARACHRREEEQARLDREREAREQREREEQWKREETAAQQAQVEKEQQAVESAAQKPEVRGAALTIYWCELQAKRDEAMAAINREKAGAKIGGVVDMRVMHDGQTQVVDADEALKKLRPRLKGTLSKAKLCKGETMEMAQCHARPDLAGCEGDQMSLMMRVIDYVIEDN